jgi:hypothetical protein
MNKAKDVVPVVANLEASAFMDPGLAAHAANRDDNQ